MYGFPERRLEPDDPAPCYCDDACTCECECDVECAEGEHPCRCATHCECDVAGDLRDEAADHAYELAREDRYAS